MNEPDSAATEGLEYDTNAQLDSAFSKGSGSAVKYEALAQTLMASNEDANFEFTIAIG